MKGYLTVPKPVVSFALFLCCDLKVFELVIVLNLLNSWLKLLILNLIHLIAGTEGKVKMGEAGSSVHAGPGIVTSGLSLQLWNAAIPRRW